MLHTRTRIVATVGPALDAPGVLEGAIEAGIDVLRVNLSHGSPLEQLPRIQRARLAYPEIAVVADLCGPKLRLGELSTPVNLAVGSQVVLGIGGLPVADSDFWRRVRRGDPIYLADGLIRLAAEVVAEGSVMCRVLAGGPVTSHKGINLPNDTSELPCLTAKDRRDLLEIDAIAPDFIALSYVRHEDDIATLKKLCSQPVIAKIEKQQALERLDAILAAADGLMVARGDLGVEIPIEKVPAAQKRLIRAANAAAKPVITATQMLVSMVSSPIPTRAEATDVANAALDGTDAVMLSEETAVGHDPVAVVHMMASILRETEPLAPLHFDSPVPDSPTSAIARAAVHLARDLNAEAILVPTTSGSSARLVAAFRPRMPIYAFSSFRETVHRLALVWGVSALQVTPQGVQGDIVAKTLAEARQFLPAGARVVLTAGWPPGVAGNTSGIYTATI